MRETNIMPNIHISNQDESKDELNLNESTDTSPNAANETLAKLQADFAAMLERVKLLELEMVENKRAQADQHYQLARAKEELRVMQSNDSSGGISVNVAPPTKSFLSR